MIISSAPLCIIVCFGNTRGEIFADDEIQKYSRDEIFVGDKKSYETIRGFAEKPRNPRKLYPQKFMPLRYITINNCTIL